MSLAERYYGRVFLLIVGALALAAAFQYQLPPTAALAVLVLGVVLLGLPHGALDPMVARKAFAHQRTDWKLAFYAAYLGLAVGYGLLWWRYPTLGLSSFLAIAALHFGSDWQHRGIALTRLGYGLTIVTLPALTHPAEVAEIYAVLGTAHAHRLVHISGVVAAIAVVVAAAGATARWKEKRSDLFEFAGIVVGATLLGPLVFFTCYFCLLHSPRHLLETAEGLGMTSLRKICVVTAPVVLATILLSGIVWLLLPGVSWTGRVLTLVFVGLAALTVPHMLLERITEPSR